MGPLVGGGQKRRPRLGFSQARSRQLEYRIGRLRLVALPPDPYLSPGKARRVSDVLDHGAQGSAPQLPVVVVLMTFEAEAASTALVGPEVKDMRAEKMCTNSIIWCDELGIECGSTFIPSDER